MKPKNSKKREKWTTLLRFQKEYFNIIEHYPYNNLTLINHQDWNTGGPKTFTRTPLVKKFKRTETYPDIFNGKKEITHTYNDKEVDVIFFTPKQGWHDPPQLEEKEWLKKSVEILNSAVVNRVTIALEKNEDKVKLSIFKFSKSRMAGHRYFAKRSDDLHITFNTTTKNFFITKSDFLNRRRNTNTTKNDFLKIRTILNQIDVKQLLTATTWFEGHMNPNNSQDTNTVTQLTNFMSDVGKKLEKELKVKTNLSVFGEGIGELLMDWFVKVRKIKVPNDYHYYLPYHYPGIRELKKFNMNLGRTILNNKGLNGKYYVKLINTYGGYNLTDLMNIKNIFGEKHCKLVPKEFLKISSYTPDVKINLFNESPIYNSKMTDNREKLNLIKILKNINDPHFITQIYDHLQMKTVLGSYGLKKRIKSYTEEKFHEEHQEWAELIHQCERNEQTTYQYQDNFIINMEKDINYEETNYKVKVLSNDLEYFNEGQVQSHCVRSYLDRYESIIVSVRKDNLDSMERMTCEFTHNVENLKDYSPARLIQTRMKYNKLPKGEWKKIEEKLNKRFIGFLKHNKLKKPKIELYNKISNIKYDGYKVKRPYLNNILLEDLPF